MDYIAGLLDGPRAREAFLLRSILEPPWSLRIADEAPLTVLAPVRGEAWVWFDGEPAVWLGPGDVAVVRGPEHYTVADAPGTPWQMRIGPGQVCSSPDGSLVAPMAGLGPRSWGNRPDGATMLVTGTYQLRSEVSRRLLGALPALLRVTAASWENPLVGYLATEIARDEPGQEAVLDRLLDLLLIAVLREWFGRGEAPGWYRAHDDPVVGPALRLIHERPAEPWTLAGLATATGCSRAALARRFRDLVGEPPMTFLTNWRLTLAADLLREPGVTLGSVARQVGYGSPFALSAAFKRVRGMSPAEHRAITAD